MYLKSLNPKTILVHKMVKIIKKEKDLIFAYPIAFDQATEIY